MRFARPGAFHVVLLSLPEFDHYGQAVFVVSRELGVQHDERAALTPPELYGIGRAQQAPKPSNVLALMIRTLRSRWSFKSLFSCAGRNSPASIRHLLKTAHCWCQLWRTEVIGLAARYGQAAETKANSSGRELPV